MTKRLWLSIAILILAAGLRLHNLSTDSIWFDEGWSAYAAAQPSLWATFNADATNPPLYYGLIYLSGQLTGHSEFGLRWLSFALGMIAVALAGRLAHTYFRRGSGFALLLAAVSTPLIWASQEMRMYTLMTVFVSGLALAWHTLLHAPSRRAWLWLVALELAVLYAHNTGPVIVLWLNAAAVAAWLVNRQFPFIRWLWVQVIVGTAWLPYFITRFLTLTDANSALIRRTIPDLQVWAGMWVAPWEALSTETTAFWLTLPLLLLPLLILRTNGGRWLLLHLLTLVAGLLAALAVLGVELHGRYLVMLVPLLIALIGGIPNYIRWGFAMYAVIIGGIGYRLLAHPAYQNDDARGMVRYYAEKLTADDTVLAWSYADRYELRYYWDRLQPQANRITLPEGATMAEIAPLLPITGDISRNVWYTQRADYRGMLDCMLSNGLTGDISSYQVNGMATYTYINPPLHPITMRPLQASFEVADMLAAGRLPTTFQADQRLCIPIQIRLNTPTPAELKAAITVTNPQGITVWQSEGSVFTTPNGRTSIDQTTGETLTAFPIITLPVGTPPGLYTVQLRLFDDTILSGYDLIQNNTPIGKDFLLGEWQVRAGATWNIAPLSPGEISVSAFPDHVTANNGEMLTFEFLWELDNTTETLPTVTLQDIDRGWSVMVPSLVDTPGLILREWRQIQVPAYAESGSAVLAVDGIGEVATVTVEYIPAVYELPTITNPANAVFPDIGTIRGYEINDNIVTLIWQATDQPNIDRNYTVFVQFLDGNGNLIAQSDTQPANGQRPMMGWRSDEIITDTHTMQYRLTPPSSESEQLTLIVGLYDASGNRVSLPNGNTYHTLQTR